MFRAEFTWHTINDTERSQCITFGGHERHAGVKTNVGFRGYQRVIRKTFIFQRIPNDKEVNVCHGQNSIKKTSLIECVHDQLKNICQIEHSRHRSVYNYFMVNVVTVLTANISAKKPSPMKSSGISFGGKLPVIF